MKIYQDEEFFMEIEPHEVPWVKIFTTKEYKELSDMPKEQRQRLWELYDIVEEEMRVYFQPDKINMASFGNMLPRVHIHVMARFKNDSYFPNPLWGEKTQESSLDLPSFELFYEHLTKQLNEVFAIRSQDTHV